MSNRKLSVSERVGELLEDLFLPNPVLRRLSAAKPARGSLSKSAEANAAKLKPSNDGNDSKKKDEDASAETTHFTDAQDKSLVELKEKEKPWKDIAIELGKTQEVCKARWTQIKPADFDKKLAEKKKEEKQRKKDGGGGGAGGGNDGTYSGSGKNKGKNANSNAQAKKGVGNDGIPDWNTPDANWSRKELDIVNLILREELRGAFARTSQRLAIETDGMKKVHPDSIAEKFLGRRPDWHD